MALLYILHQQNLPIVALHVNHRIQALSDDWEKLVNDFCHAHNIPFLSKHLAFDTAKKVSENHARQARYQAISELIQAYFAPKPLPYTPILALAHHANDQAETVLMNLCHGAGLHGLSGMNEWALQHEFSQPLLLWRPLLSATREKINEFVAEQNLPYIDDPTNVTGDNLRALLRQHILPTLAQVSGLTASGLVQNISRGSHNLADGAQLLDQQADILLKNCQKPSWTTALQCLDIATLRKLSEPQRFYLLHYWLKMQMTFAPPRRFIENVNGLILSDNPDQQTILQWRNQQIRRYRDTLYLLSEHYIALLKWAENGANDKVSILENTTVNLANIENFTFTMLFNFLQKISQSLIIRKIQHGEKFQLINRAQHQTVKNICQTLAIPSWERSLARVIEINIAQKIVPIAVIFPSHTVWLASEKDFGENKISMLFEKNDLHKR